MCVSCVGIVVRVGAISFHIGATLPMLVLTPLHWFALFMLVLFPLHWCLSWCYFLCVCVAFLALVLFFFLCSSCYSSNMLLLFFVCWCCCFSFTNVVVFLMLVLQFFLS